MTTKPHQQQQPQPLHSIEMDERKSLAQSWFAELIDVDVLFACSVCHVKVSVDHPLHCSECSKLFCGACIERWFTTTNHQQYGQRCPCCQTRLQASEFIYCRLYQEVNEIFERLPSRLEELIRLVNRPLRVCARHDKELIAFCEACRECVCVKCLFGEPHQKHLGSVMELEDARQKFKNIISAERNFLLERLGALTLTGEQLAAKERLIMKEAEGLVEEVNTAADRIIERIRARMSEQLVNHIEPVKSVANQQQNEVQAVLNKVTELDNEATCPDVMMLTVQMVETIRKMHREPPAQLQPVTGSFVNPITPAPVELSFVIHNFSQKLFLIRKAVSEDQTVEGFKLRLKGHQDQDENGNDVVKLSLVVVEGYDVHDVKVTCYPAKRSKVEPLVRLMDLHVAEDNTVLEFADFQGMEGFLTEVTDELNLRIKFRLWKTYYDKCIHKDWYIGRMTGLDPKWKGMFIGTS